MSSISKPFLSTVSTTVAPLDDTTMTSNQSEADDFDPLCAQYETYTTVRFIFITLATVIACLGTAANLLLIRIFAIKKPASTTPATLYPTILAFLDFAICLEYLLLFGVDAVVSFVKVEAVTAFYLNVSERVVCLSPLKLSQSQIFASYVNSCQNLPRPFGCVNSLFSLYYMYIIPAYVASRVTQLAIPYMLVFATLERLVWTSGTIRSRFLLAMLSTSGRYFTAIISLLVCVALRLPTAFAIEVAVYPLCDDFLRTMTTQPREWTHDSAVYYFFDFHIMTITQTLVPFVILFALNIVIIRKLTATSDKKEIMCDSHAHINSLNSAHSPSANGDVGASASPMLQATHGWWRLRVIRCAIAPIASEFLSLYRT
ncbi:unnamed protein product [Nippostrongylus brasiliensis]|uniref:G_PROTEIN_RECEP_F1_2 domain-containing protein n=1 Tax=Nippostrongylus brasiliensis TaxID=27835 RepID=A0A158R3N7_NIPBR|nr:unnamed protein product [Nippostrongylus brasiliensis]